MALNKRYGIVGVGGVGWGEGGKELKTKGPCRIGNCGLKSMNGINLFPPTFLMCHFSHHALLIIVSMTQLIFHPTHITSHMFFFFFL